jgi:hypothetical protein
VIWQAIGLHVNRSYGKGKVYAPIAFGPRRRVNLKPEFLGKGSLARYPHKFIIRA